MGRSARRRKNLRMLRMARLRQTSPRQWARAVADLKTEWAWAARQTASQARHTDDGPVVAVMRFMAKKVEEAREYGIEDQLVEACLDALTSVPNGRVGHSSVRTLRLNEMAVISTRRAPYAVCCLARDVVPP